MAAAAILDFWNREILLVTGVQRMETHQHAKFCQNRSIGYEDNKIFSIFQDGGRPPSWICLGHIWTTHSQYLGVSITLQNLVMIDAVVFLIIWTFQYLARLAKNPYSRPKIGVFGQFDPLNGLQYQQKPKRHILAWIRVIWAIKRENVVSGLTCRCVA